MTLVDNDNNAPRCSVVDNNDDERRGREREEGIRMRNFILYPLITYIIQTNVIDPTPM